MGSKNAFFRNIVSPRRLIKKSATISLIFFICFVTVTLSFLYRNSEKRLSAQSEQIVAYSSHFLNDLTTTMSQLIPLTEKSCKLAEPALQYKAAFTNGVRTFLLVRNGFTYCSSATGEMHVSSNAIYPKLNLYQTLDFKLQQGTPILPDKPAVAVWLRQPGRGNTGVLTTLELNLRPYLLLNFNDKGVNGMAIIIGNQAVTTFNAKVIPIEQLPDTASREIQIPGYPIKLLLYSVNFTASDIRIILLGGLLLAAFVGISAYYIMSNRQNPEAEILRGMKRGEFFIEYQPVFEATSRKMSGLEALVRWEHPTEGRIPPDLFIPVVEAQGLIQQLTQHLFDLIIADAARMVGSIPTGTKLAFNISPLHLGEPTFREDVLSLLARLPLDTFDPIFEITERGMVEEEQAISQFAWLREHGVKIAVDDFGTGHSALIYLERFTLDYIKIDRAFINNIGFETLTAPVLDSVLILAKNLKIETVAEGIETEQQAQYLIAHGVHFLQGYLLSRPLTLEKLLKFCNENKFL
ncbi:cyclic di-GMP phosphodiesterase [Yersinia sp. J1]|uniref:cyclic di-GMP phosphodiesterase n=1 Tax=Yersinia sp. J1 TaxID=3424774 RepID=UPI003D3690AF